MSYRRQQSKSSTDSIILITTILIVSTAWEHKANLLKIEQVAIYVLILSALICLVIYLIKHKPKIIKRPSLNNSSLADIDKMTGLEFEQYLTGALKRQGYESVRLTEKYDYGIDIIAVKDGITWGIQVKRYKGLVDVDAVRQVVTALAKYRCDRSMVITNSYYTEVAKELAKWNNCILIDRNTLKHWVI